MVTTFVPFACAIGMRQLFTSISSKITEHEPHSPSPQPSLAPVNPRSFRSTSNNLSMGWASTFLASPFTVNENSHFALAAGEGFMTSLVPTEKQLARGIQAPEPQRDVRAAAEWNSTGHPS